MEMMTLSSAECILPRTAALQDVFDSVQQRIGRLSLQLSFLCPSGQPQMELDTAGIDCKHIVPASHLMR